MMTFAARLVVVLSLLLAVSGARTTAAAGGEDIEGHIARVREWSRNDPSRALVEGHEALAQLERQRRGGSPQAVELLNWLCVAARNLGRSEQSQAYGQRALTLAKAGNDLGGQAKSLNNLGVVAVDQGQAQRAVEYFTAAQIISRATGDRKAEAAAHNNIGIVREMRGEFEPARQQYLQALAIKREVGDDNGMASTFLNIAVVSRRMGEYGQAVDYLLQALKLSERKGDRRGTAAALNNLASLYADMGNHRQALENYQRTLRLDREMRNPAGEATTLHNIGLSYGKLGDPQRALAYLQHGLRIRQQLNDRSAVAASLNAVGNAHRDLGRYAIALGDLGKALAIRRELNERLEVAQSLLDVATCRRLRGDYAAAAAAIREAQDLARQGKAVELEKFIYLELSEIEAGRRHFAVALASLRRYKEIQDRLFDEASQRRIFELQMRYEAGKRQQEMELLRRDRDIRRLQARRQQLLKNASLGGVGLLLLLVTLLLNRYRLKARASREIERTNAELSEAYAQLDRVARIDPLTGVSNRRDVLERLRHEIARFERNRKPLVLAIGDVDDFKSCNDRFGHEAGDRVLQSVASAIGALIRKQDIFGRWGGEEFLLALPETDAAGASTLLEKIRAAVAAWPGPQSPLPRITVTFGYAALRRADDLDECLRRADQALYRGKQAGKNRVCGEE